MYSINIDFTPKKSIFFNLPQTDPTHPKNIYCTQFTPKISIILEKYRNNLIITILPEKHQFYPIKLDHTRITLYRSKLP